MSQTKPFAAYCRVSDEHGDADDSLHTQLASIRQFADARGLEIPPDLVVFERFSGMKTADIRPGLGRIRELARVGAIGGVIVHNTERLARDMTDLQVLVEEFRRRGCRVHCVLVPIEDNSTGKVMLAIRGWAHEVEWELIQERTMRVKKEIRDAGQLVGEGGGRYGLTWDKKTRTRVADPRIAPWVRRIYDWLANQGWTLTEIADELNRHQVPTPGARRGLPPRSRRARWTTGIIHALVRDEVYKGVSTHLRYETIGRKKYRKLPRERWTVAHDAKTEALVDAATWDRAVAAMSARHHARIGHAAGRAARASTFLRGRIYCMACRGPMWVSYTRDRRAGDGPAYRPCYRCNRHLRTPGTPACPVRAVYDDEIRDVAWAEVVRVLTTAGLIEQEIARMTRDKPGEALHRESLAAAERAKQDAERRAQNMMESFGRQDDPELRDMILREVAQANRERDGHAARIAQLQGLLAGYDAIDAKAEALARHAAQVRAGLENQAAQTWDQRRHILDWLDARFLGDGHHLNLCLDLGLGDDGALAVPSTGCSTTRTNCERAWLVF
jgi:DNA invertase Pin-like site-specific DNA recombinase